MKTILIILTLFGCDDSGLLCDVLAQPETAFETQADCMDDADRLLEQALVEPYPLLVTQCASADRTNEFIAEVAPPERTAAAARRTREDGRF